MLNIRVNMQPIPRIRMTRYGQWKPQVRKNNDHLHKLAAEIKKQAKGVKFTGDVGLFVRFRREKMRRADTDNLAKMVMDACQHSGVIENDRQFLPILCFPFYGCGDPCYEISIFEVGRYRIEELAAKALVLCGAFEHALDFRKLHMADILSYVSNP